MKPFQYQLDTAKELWNILLQTKGYAYMAALPRFGKTLTSLLTIEYSKRINSVLILCPKAAIPGWLKFINDEELKQYLTKEYTAINYEALGKIQLRTLSKSGTPLKKPIPELHFKLDPQAYDIVILDEAHRIGKVGKPNQRYKILKAFIQDKPWIALSGTQVVETPLAIYYQTTLSSRTPFPQISFYEFFKEYGIPAPMKIFDRQVEQYKLFKPKLLDIINEFTLFKTQTDAGISADLKSTDVLHYVDLDTSTKVLYNKLQADRIVTLPTGHTLVCDTIMKLRTSLHQLESGTVKIDDESIFLGNLEKINYLKQHFKLTENTVILAYYISEQQLLKVHFPQCIVDSVTSKAEGVDYSGKEFIIFSMGWSGAKGIQVAERVVNVNNTEQAIVNYILCRHAISDQVYACVKQKKTFNDSTYKPKDL